MNLSLEGWMFFHQLPELADFAKSVPKLTIVLNHIGGLIGIGPYSNLEDVIPIWKKGISLVAACPNIVIKLGGMGMEMQGFGWHSRRTPISSDDLASQMAPYIEYCIEQFGPNRCMFESNFPVDKVSYSYVVMYNAFKKLSRSYSNSERAAMFHDNAAEIYRIA
jgi:predicted TIM-barrel fold metal-dependent hydrolase